MVTRKPVPQSAGLAPTASPPYPVTPVSTNASQPFSTQNAPEELRIGADPTSSTSNVWSVEGLDGPSKSNSSTEHASKPLPDALKVGPSSLSHSQNSSREALRPDQNITNPFLKKQLTGGTSSSKESSASAWRESALNLPLPPSHTPPPPPIPQDHTLHQKLSNLSISESNTNPWQSANGQRSQLQRPSVPQLQKEDSGNAAWSNASPARPAPSIPPVKTSHQTDLIDFDEPESPAWDEEGYDDGHEEPAELPASTPQDLQELDDGKVWDESHGKGKQAAASTAQPLNAVEAVQAGEGWNLIDHEPATSGAQQSGVITSDGREITGSEEEVPNLPPRPSQEEGPPPQPPRPTITTHFPSSSSLLSSGTQNSVVKKQKKETYEIKKITWHDVNAEKNPRISPILVQNANGPCPLLALVNALTLSTPPSVETALVETLRTREQVSLGLLLDAVFDELMSGRRGDAAQELPDVSDLYSFLITLHTGMNVNPRFVPAAPSNSSNDPRNSMSHIHPGEREDSMPGTFEETREMRLYSTFSVPLIHGWLPEHDSPAFISLSRSAKSYEDAQNLMFREEELEDKIRREGLSFEEQATLEDIATIKAFFQSNATQLTQFGLGTITNSMAPGSVTILFRNDHFSTLYRHPDTLQLLQLVTDMGYAGHEEVVWESLIDVNGEKAEFFSGDFRLVGGAPSTPHSEYAPPPGPPPSHTSNKSWTTVTGRRGNSRQTQQNLSTPNQSSSHQEPPTPRSPNTEQEDHDLALALQMQEEEEERHRNEIARRRRETELSQQYIEQQGSRDTGIPVHHRGGGRGGSARASVGRGGRSVSSPVDIRPALPSRRNQPAAADPEAGVDAPPPTYEQAATEAAYNPPHGHPSHPNQPPRSGRRMSAYSANAQSMQASSPTLGRRRATGSGPTFDQIAGGPRMGQQQQPVGQGRERDCIIM